LGIVSMILDIATCHFCHLPNSYSIFMLEMHAIWIWSNQHFEWNLKFHVASVFLLYYLLTLLYYT
jgi:hypothetical protein